MESTLRKYTNRIASILTAIVMILVSMSFPIGGTSALEQPADNELKEKANQLALLVNEARKAEGLPPVYVLPYLNDKARERSREAITLFSHTRPDGTKFSTILDQNLINYRKALENIAGGGEGDAEATLDQFRNSSSHWEAIIDPKITHIGVGCSYEANSALVWYWDIIFVNSRNEYREQYIPTKFAITPKCDGDVDGDGTLTVYDYATIVDYVIKKKNNDIALLPDATEEQKAKYYPVYFNEAQEEAADCLMDGFLTISDATLLSSYILGDVKKLPLTMDEYVEHKAKRMLEQLQQK